MTLDEALNLVKTGKPDNLVEALKSLSTLEGVDVVRLERDLESSNILVRWFAAAVLGYVADERAREALRRALQDESASVRVSAAQSLVALSSAEGIPTLIDALASDEIMIGHPPQLVSQYARALLEAQTERRIDFDPSDPTQRLHASRSWREWWGSIGSEEQERKGR